MYEGLLRRLIRHCQTDGIVLPDYLKLKLYKLRNISDISEEEIINTSADIENVHSLLILSTIYLKMLKVSIVLCFSFG